MTKLENGEILCFNCLHAVKKIRGIVAHIQDEYSGILCMKISILKDRNEKIIKQKPCNCINPEISYPCEKHETRHNEEGCPFCISENESSK